ncbi:hypothetical protein N7468_000733 [Penicillium chermesinum]|uniref:Amidohydrolase-related domain-containing protein n=1 Tax=Penicillium chermesinum TaxID=63820 RepID=A0A9W9PKV7_9EURO|nr:uncharacterized protein N7468_000733 [Penicillium chermesinum]KAJ5249282.1 hypothetical protein N7468_000733 [Penicillium chermesinum]
MASEPRPLSPTYIHIKNASVITVDATAGVLSNCDVLLENDAIRATGPNLDVPSDVSLTVIDATNCIVVPGFVNGHHHLWQHLIRGVSTDWSLFDYLVSIRSLYGSVYTADDVELAYYAGALDLLNNGVTCILEHSHIINSPEHADAAIRGLKKLAQRVRDARRVREVHFTNNNPAEELLTFGIAPTEPESQPLDETVRQILLSRDLGARITTMHVAMGPYDTAHQEVVQHLANEHILGPDLVFSHGASLTDSELDSIRSTGAGVVSTPDTELQMGMGFPVAFRATDKGCNACLGLDITSNQGNDFMTQMRLALQVQRAVDNQGGLPLAIRRKTAEVLRMGTLGGAEVLRVDHLVGSIAVGKKADLVIFRCDDISTLPVHDPTATVIFHTSSANIDTVIVNGRIVKKDGRLVGADWPSVRSAVLSQSERIKAQAAKVDLGAARAKWLEVFFSATVMLTATRSSVDFCVYRLDLHMKIVLILRVVVRK